MLSNLVVLRIIDWNRQRYDQVFNKQLAEDLLLEELMEYETAQTPVDRLDALCDLTYIAVGILWKMNKLDMVECIYTKVPPKAFLDWYVDRFCSADEPKLMAGTIGCIINACEDLSGLSEALFNKAMLIVCDSNDSKSVKKTDPSVKANIDKGSSFIPPEPRLQLILQEHANANKKV